jgi:hypothetical protein
LTCQSPRTVTVVSRVSRQGAPRPPTRVGARAGVSRCPNWTVWTPVSDTLDCPEWTPRTPLYGTHGDRRTPRFPFSTGKRCRVPYAGRRGRARGPVENGRGKCRGIPRWKSTESNRSRPVRGERRRGPTRVGARGGIVRERGRSRRTMAGSKQPSRLLHRGQAVREGGFPPQMPESTVRAALKRVAGSYESRSRAASAASAGPSSAM